MRRASLAQLVALCAHLTNNPLPPSNNSTAPSGEDAVFALPVPNPNDSRQALQEQSTAERTPQKGPSPESSEAQQSRRRFNSAQATEADMIDPNFISPAKNNPSREYAGGPAKGNLRGMFSPSGPGATAQDAYAAAPQDKYSSPANAYQQQQSQQQDAYTSSRRPSGTYHSPQDPQFSKTLRAPYANVNPTPKYPSPSSSPPTTGNIMSGLVSGFTAGYQQPMQNSHSSTRSGQSAGHTVASSTSPAAATIGMMGNLIAYVFNPSPTTNSMAESARAHSQQKQAQHARTTSLDRANPPNFGNLGSGTPPPGSSSRARESYGRPTPVRENYFPAEPQQSDSGYNYARNASSGLSVDDDFVMINKSSTDNDRERRPGSEAKSTPSTNPSSNNSAYNSSNTGGSGDNPGGTAVNVAPRTATPAQYAAQLESEARAHETAALQALYSSIVHKCEVYCAVVSTISSLGDQYVREAITPQQRMQQQQLQAQMQQKMDSSDAAEDDDGDSIAGFLHPSSDPKPYQQQAAADRYLIACSLYLHALSILSRLTKSFEVDLSMDKGQQMAAAMDKLKSDLRTVFDQLIARAESCQKQIDSIVNPDSGSTGALGSKYTMPQAEPVMIQAAVKKEADASMEELLGNLQL